MQKIYAIGMFNSWDVLEEAGGIGQDDLGLHNAQEAINQLGLNARLSLIPQGKPDDDALDKVEAAG